MKGSSKLSGLLALGLMLFAVLACSTGDVGTKDSCSGERNRVRRNDDEDGRAVA